MKMYTFFFFKNNIKIITYIDTDTSAEKAEEIEYIYDGDSILIEDGKIKGIVTAQGETYFANAVIICSGVYLKAKIIVGEYTKESGPNGFLRAENLTKSLIEHGIEVRRFKTGTPARMNGKTIFIYSDHTISLLSCILSQFSFYCKKSK